MVRDRHFPRRRARPRRILRLVDPSQHPLDAEAHDFRARTEITHVDRRSRSSTASDHTTQPQDEVTQSIVENVPKSATATTAKPGTVRKTRPSPYCPQAERPLDGSCDLSVKEETVKQERQHSDHDRNGEYAVVGLSGWVHAMSVTVTRAHSRAPLRAAHGATWRVGGGVVGLRPDSGHLAATEASLALLG
jgi:hypothetical protein